MCTYILTALFVWIRVSQTEVLLLQNHACGTVCNRSPAMENLVNIWKHIYSGPKSMVHRQCDFFCYAYTLIYLLKLLLLHWLSLHQYRCATVPPCTISLVLLCCVEAAGMLEICWQVERGCSSTVRQCTHSQRVWSADVWTLATRFVSATQQRARAVHQVMAQYSLFAKLMLSLGVLFAVATPRAGAGHNAP